MQYEWDSKKANLNYLKHKIRFADVISVFEDINALTIEDENSIKEERFITMGIDFFGRILVVIYTWRNNNIRIISARKTNKTERRQYESGI